MYLRQERPVFYRKYRLFFDNIGLLRKASEARCVCVCVCVCVCLCVCGEGWGWRGVQRYGVQ